MARRRSEELWQRWRNVVADHESSGLPVAEFCRQRKVSPPSFYAWRRKVSVASSRAAMICPTPSTAAPPLFVPLPVTDSVGPGDLFEIKFPSGIRVSVPPRFEVSGLASLLKAVTLCENGNA